jgi:hypothetical protein
VENGVRSGKLTFSNFSINEKFPIGALPDLTPRENGVRSGKLTFSNFSINEKFPIGALPDLTPSRVYVLQQSAAKDPALRTLIDIIRGQQMLPLLH